MTVGEFFFPKSTTHTYLHNDEINSSLDECCASILHHSLSDCVCNQNSLYKIVMDREIHWGSVYQDDTSKRNILEDILPWNQKYRVASFEVIQENDIPCEVKFQCNRQLNQEGFTNIVVVNQQQAEERSRILNTECSLL